MKAEAGALDKLVVRRSFDRAAATYDQHAPIQREVGTRLLERVAEIRIEPRSVLDIGAGTGYCTEALARRFRRARVLGLDISTAMIHAARSSKRLRLYPKPRYLVADMEALPSGSRMFDIMFSNLSFQWATNLDRLFGELYRVGRPGTPLIFSTFGPDTLHELRASWRAADDGVHVNRFADMHDVGDLLMGAGFTDVVMDVDRLTDFHPELLSIMRGLKFIGAHNINTERRRALTGKRQLERVRESYERFRTDRGLPVSYEVVYGLAWIPEPTTVMFSAPGDKG